MLDPDAGIPLESSLREENARLKQELERERLRLAGCGVAALGYHKRSDTVQDEYRSSSMDDTISLREKYDKLVALVENPKRCFIAPEGAEIVSVQMNVKPVKTLDYINLEELLNGK